MRKIIVLLFTLILSISLSACGNKNNSSGSNPSLQSGKTDKNSKEVQKSTVHKKTSSTMESVSAKGARIKLTFEGKEVIVKMYDNPSSRDLLAQLPLTLNFKDYAGVEKIAYPSKPITTKDAASGADPKLGDLALYSPWGNLVIYYGDSDYADGLIILGHIESGIEQVGVMKKDFTVKIERMD